mmetsp:Transcript_33974/g.84677  ORF Transcript_33974/g.84677 Transcript_33974/m.84677 type:complete len:659 (-) Transcript_33974:448-2424(-)
MGERGAVDDEVDAVRAEARDDQLQGVLPLRRLAHGGRALEGAVAAAVAREEGRVDAHRVVRRQPLRVAHGEGEQRGRVQRGGEGKRLPAVERRGAGHGGRADDHARGDPRQLRDGALHVAHRRQLHRGVHRRVVVPRGEAPRAHAHANVHRGGHASLARRHHHARRVEHGQPRRGGGVEHVPRVAGVGSFGHHVPQRAADAQRERDVDIRRGVVFRLRQSDECHGRLQVEPREVLRDERRDAPRVRGEDVRRRARVAHARRRDGALGARAEGGGDRGALRRRPRRAEGLRAAHTRRREREPAGQLRRRRRAANQLDGMQRVGAAGGGDVERAEERGLDARAFEETGRRLVRRAAVADRHVRRREVRLAVCARGGEQRGAEVRGARGERHVREGDSFLAAAAAGRRRVDVRTAAHPVGAASGGARDRAVGDGRERRAREEDPPASGKVPERRRVDDGRALERKGRVLLDVDPAAVGVQRDRRRARHSRRGQVEGAAPRVDAASVRGGACGDGGGDAGRVEDAAAGELHGAVEHEDAAAARVILTGHLAVDDCAGDEGRHAAPHKYAASVRVRAGGDGADDDRVEHGDRPALHEDAAARRVLALDGGVGDEAGGDDDRAGFHEDAAAIRVRPLGGHGGDGGGIDLHLRHGALHGDAAAVR